MAQFLALPILDFGAISARSQMDRLAQGRIIVDKFDWRAMAFAFGPTGRKQLQANADHGPPKERKLAAAALAADSRWSVDAAVDKAKPADSLDQWLRMVPANRPAPPALRSAIVDSNHCRGRACVMAWIDDRHVIVAGKLTADADLTSKMLELQKDTSWSEAISGVEGNWETITIGKQSVAKSQNEGPNIAAAPVEVRTIQRRQLYIDGKPVGEVFKWGAGLCLKGVDRAAIGA